jgi:hypothetical protein
VPPDVQVVVPRAESHKAYRACMLMTTNGAVNTSVAVHGWMVLKSACTAHLHMIDAFVTPNNDAAVRPPQLIHPYRASLLMTTNGAMVTIVAVHGCMVLKPACTAHLHMIYAFVSPNNDACVVPYLQSQSVGYSIGTHASSNRTDRYNSMVTMCWVQGLVAILVYLSEGQM